MPPVPIGQSRLAQGDAARLDLTTDYVGPMLDLGRLDLDEIANALADQTDYEHRWLINRDTAGSFLSGVL
jgi:hypothetical protein